jgi:hypothetical protein
MQTQDFPIKSEFARVQRAIAGANAVVTFLEARGLVLSDEQKHRILACTDLDVVNDWVRRAATIKSIDELFV